MERSASVTRIAAWRKVLVGGGPSTASVPGSSATTILAGRSSRYMLNATHSSKSPTCQQKPGNFQKPGRNQCKGDEKHQRHANPEHQDALPVPCGKPGRQCSHDHDIVTCHGEVDENHLQQCCAMPAAVNTSAKSITEHLRSKQLTASDHKMGAAARAIADNDPISETLPMIGN